LRNSLTSYQTGNTYNYSHTNLHWNLGIEAHLIASIQSPQYIVSKADTGTRNAW
jgi:hypothetical protein